MPRPLGGAVERAQQSGGGSGMVGTVMGTLSALVVDRVESTSASSQSPHHLGTMAAKPDALI